MSTSKRSTSTSSSSSKKISSSSSSSSTSIAATAPNRNRNSNPNPLYNTHLQPSPPPPSSTEEQLDLWERVITRRTSQLLRLNLQSLQSFYELLFDDSVSKITARELTDLLEKLPSKKPKTVDHYISIARYLLIGHFHHSIDQRIKPEGRADSLSCVKEILSCIDLTYAEFVAQQLKDKEKDKNLKYKELKDKQLKDKELKDKQLKDKELKDKQLKDKEEKENKDKEEKENKEKERAKKQSGVARLPTQEDKDKGKDRRAEGEHRKEQSSDTSKATKPMGLTSSKPVDTVIELLDDTPPSSPARQGDDEEKADDSNKTNVIKSNDDNNNNDNSNSNSNISTNTNTTNNNNGKNINNQSNHESNNSNNNNINNNHNSSNNSTRETVTRKSSNGLPLPPPANDLPPLPITAFAAPQAPQSQTPVNPTNTTPSSPLKAKPRPHNPPPPPPPRPPPRQSVPDHERTVIAKQLSFQRDEPPPQSKNPPTFSASLQPRPACTVVINVGLDKPPYATTTLDGPGVDDLYTRLARWEPYWKLVHDCGLKKITRQNSSAQYEVGCKTTRVNRCAGVVGNEKPTAATQLKFAIPLEVLHSAPALDWGCFRAHPGKLSYKLGERRLLLRALPLNMPQKYMKKKSDTHLWPKGCFVQLNSTPIMLAQRKQQSHDRKLWKGMCHTLDLTQFVPQPTLLNDLCICTKDEIEYAIQVAMLEYISPDALYDLCMNTSVLPPDTHNENSIQKLTKEEGFAVARGYLKKDAVVLDDDDDGGKPPSTTTNTPADITLTFSLLCSMSMTAMTTPVRGKNCRHMQCFDLRNYLRTNSTVSGGRWRCAVCEDFVPVQDLVVDGMMVSMLEDLGRDRISGSRDKIQMSKDGAWKFMEENRLKYSKKRPMGDKDEEEDNRIRKKLNNGATRQASEVIELM